MDLEESEIETYADQLNEFYTLVAKVEQIVGWQLEHSEVFWTYALWRKGLNVQTIAEIISKAIDKRHKNAPSSGGPTT